MNWFEKYMLRRIAKKLVVQSHAHQFHISEFYRVINRAAQEEFLEETQPSLDAFLRECHEESLQRCKWDGKY